MKFLSFRFLRDIDWSLYIIPIILVFFGVSVIFTITYGTKSTMATDQLIFGVIGLAMAISISLVDYRTLKGLYIILYILGLVLLLTVLVIGTTSFGATRWINLGFTQIQPSELFKLIMVIFLAKIFSELEEVDLKKFLWIVLLCAIPVLLILFQPDLGTASVIFVTSVVLFIISPFKKIYLIVGLAVMIALTPVAWKFLKPYQKNRIEAFINPTSDPHGAGYNVSQAKIAVGSGGFLGMGLGKGSQSQLNFLPVAHTDFIFAGSAEATGFVGSVFILGLLTILVLRAISIAQVAKDYFGMYLSVGIATIFLFQTLVNAGMNMGILPVTGIPLPFVSYGGSAMITTMVGIGILQSVFMRHRKISF